MRNNTQSTTSSTPAKSGPAIPYFIAESNGRYKARRTLTEDQIIKAAKQLLNHRVCKGTALTKPDVVRMYLSANLATLEHEVFVCLFLDNQHRIICMEEMFRGTIDGASVYPREVVKRALELNTAAVIFAHNHPSGSLAPSQADKNITEKLIKALSMFDIRVLDHFIIGGGDQYSFAEHSLI